MILATESTTYITIGMVISAALILTIPVQGYKTYALRNQRNRAWVIGSLLANVMTFATACIAIITIPIRNVEIRHWLTSIIVTAILFGNLLSSGARSRSSNEYAQQDLPN